MPSNEIRTTNLTGNISIITNPEVIKVKVIKKKYVEQMSFCVITHQGYEEFDLVGQTRGYLVVMTELGLRKIATSDYREELIRLYRIQKPESNVDESYKYSNEIITKIPQLFVD